MTNFKRAKIILYSFIIIILFVLNSEAYQKYLDTFTCEFQYFRYSYSNEEEWKSFCTDLVDISQQMRVDTFAVVGRFDNENTYRITIFANESIKKLLEQQYFLQEGRFDSFVSGSTIVEFLPLEKIQESQQITRFYFVGEKQFIGSTQNELNNIYGVGPVKMDEKPNDNWLVPLEWLVAGIFIVLLTLFDIAFQQKENFIRVSLGESVKRIIALNILKDGIAFSGIFMLSYFVLGQFIYVGYNRKRIIFLFLLMLVINMLMYLSMLRYNTKTALSKGNYSESFCGTCYCVKVFTMIFGILSFASNILVITNGVSYLAQYRIMEEYEEYSFLDLHNIESLSPEEEDMYDYYQNLIYYEGYEQFDVAFSVSNFATPYGESWKWIQINEKSSAVMDKLLKRHALDENAGLHIFIPEYLKNNPFLKDSYFQVPNYYGNTGDIGYEIIYYREDAEVLFFDETLELRSDFIQNPIISYYTIENPMQREGVLEEISIGYVFPNLMFKITDEEVEVLAEKYNLEENNLYLTRTGVTERYEQYKQKIIRTVAANTMISALLLILELSIISTIIRLEYSINSIELALKKILGYTVKKKNKGIILTIGYTALLSTAALLLLAVMFRLAQYYVILVAGILLALIELIAVVIYVAITERRNVVKILKGGAL